MERTKHNFLVHFCSGGGGVLGSVWNLFRFDFDQRTCDRLWLCVHVTQNILYRSAIYRGHCGAIFVRRLCARPTKVDRKKTQLYGLCSYVRLHSVPCVTDRIKLSTEMQCRQRGPVPDNFAEH